MDTRARLEAALADRYRVDRQIGSGGMAVVYLAEDLKQVLAAHDPDHEVFAVLVETKLATVARDRCGIE